MTRASCGGRDAGDLAPGAEGGVADGAVCGGRETMTAELEVVVDAAVGGKEALGVPG